MTDFQDLPLFGSADQAQGKPKRWTVTELTARIRGVLEPSFDDVWIVGEVSNYRPAASGHAYFSLKDDQAAISAAAFGWGRRKQTFDLKDGLKVLCHGKLTVFPPRGNYQITVDQIEPLGAGALQLAFEQLKARLAAEGLFDPKRKRPLPPFPTRLAVITSPSGAALRDVLNVLQRRAPHVRVTIVPALVQGDEAPKQLIRALEVANRCALGEVILLTRGGGSIEDLWCFNDEGLARNIAASKIPVVSAVGHEIDFTVADFVSDLRAPTPSAGAELITSHWVDVLRRLKEAGERLQASILRDLANRKNLLTHIAARIVSPRDRLREQAQRCDDLSLRLERAVQVRLEKRRAVLEQFAGKLDALSPLRVLERGYSIVRDPAQAGRLVKSAEQIQLGQELRITFHDGDRRVRAI